jgi:hypothetical protein
MTTPRRPLLTLALWGLAWVALGVMLLTHPAVAI